MCKDNGRGPAGVPVLGLVEEPVLPEVGDEVEIGTPVGELRATYLGPVSSPGKLFQAMRLMADLEQERARSESDRGSK